MKTIPAKQLKGSVGQVLKAHEDRFFSTNVDRLELTYDGIKGDYHEGLIRKSGGREPWYKRGTEMRNERQVSLVSEPELAEIATSMDIDRIEPGWIGANLVLEGIPRLSLLPSRTLLFFEGGVTLRVDGYNGPCRLAGGEIARQLGSDVDDPTQTQMALDFVKAAHLKRGLVAWVEREGTINPGESFTARIWEQWIYE